MKVLKSISLLFVAVMIAFGANAQTAATTTTTAPAKKEAKAPAKGEAKPASTPAPKAAAEKKPADARTKTGDKINHDKKGPNGETVYTGPKGGDYYLAKDGKTKTYLKK